MGKLSRTKGAAFERHVVNLLKQRLPDATIRRGKQSHLADEPDVVIGGVGAGEPWTRMWLELQDAKRPDPEGKLEQAMDDCIAAGGTRHVFPIAVCHRLGSRTITATMHYRTLFQLIHCDRGAVGYTIVLDKDSNCGTYGTVVTVDFSEFLGAVR